MLLLFVKRYFELLTIFDQIDSSGDRRIDRAEFAAALPLLASWGVKEVGDTNFSSVSQGQRHMLFDTFCSWALRHATLDVEVRDRSGEIVKLSAHHKTSDDVFASMMAPSNKGGDKQNGRTRLSSVLGLRQATKTVHSVIARIPTGKSDADKGMRQKLFAFFDTDCVGSLGPEEVDNGLRRLAGTDLDGIVAPFMLHPAVEHAFETITPFKTGGEAGRISKSDFRMFVVYLKWYSSEVGSPFAASRLKASRDSTSTLTAAEGGLQLSSSSVTSLLAASASKVRSRPSTKGKVVEPERPLTPSVLIHKLATDIKERPNPFAPPPLGVGMQANRLKHLKHIARSPSGSRLLISN